MTLPLALLHSGGIALLGYVLLGPVPAALFASGLLVGLVGYALVQPSGAGFAPIRTPFYITLGLFALHKAEEHFFAFFPALSLLTGVPVPGSTSPSALLLNALAALWLLVPFLVARDYAFGRYLAWSFFGSTGVIELAHLVFPLFTDPPLRYFPGLASAVLLVPAAWWGMSRMRKL